MGYIYAKNVLLVILNAYLTDILDFFRYIWLP